MRKYLLLSACVIGILLLGIGSGLSTSGEIKNWFALLNKPFFNPPNYLFGPVWTVLYTILGITLFNIIRLPHDSNRSIILKLFVVQMALNLSWSSVFFGAHALLGGLIVIVALWCSIVVLLYKLFKAAPVLAYINLPYLGWVSFASVLNASIWWLN